MDKNEKKINKILNIIIIILAILIVIEFIQLLPDNNRRSSIPSMSQQEIQYFNSSFTEYEGIQRGTNVRAIIVNIISNNSANQDIAGRLISLDVSEAQLTGVTETIIEPTTDDLKTNAISMIRTKINTGASYEIVLEYSEKELVNKVKIIKIGGV